MIDSHFHCWRRTEAKQAGILAAPYLQRDFSFADLEEAAGGELEAAVEIQVNEFTDGTIEARYVEGEAAAHPRLRAHIAWAQLESPDLPRQLDALGEIPIVRGIRRMCQIEPDPEFCARPDYISGARELGKRELLCEICVRLEQIVAVPRLAREAPATQIVLQHLGKPDVSRPPTTQWLKAIEELGACPNVTCKLSVVVQSDHDEHYEPERLAPFVMHAVDCFGPDRVMYASNWPVSTAVVSYTEWVAMLREMLGDNDAVFAENARTLYRL